MLLLLILMEEMVQKWPMRLGLNCQNLEASLLISRVPFFQLEKSFPKRDKKGSV